MISADELIGAGAAYFGTTFLTRTLANVSKNLESRMGWLLANHSEPIVLSIAWFGTWFATSHVDSLHKYKNAAMIGTTLSAATILAQKYAKPVAGILGLVPGAQTASSVVKAMGDVAALPPHDMVAIDIPDEHSEPDDLSDLLETVSDSDVDEGMEPIDEDA